MKRLVELDAALEGLENLNAISFYESNEHSKEAYMETKDMLKALPTVDAVEVVRCEHCKHYHSALRYCTLKGSSYWQPDDYCCRGRRKDGAQA